MADPAKRHPANVPGDFFVDTTCIDCGACREPAHDLFEIEDGASRVVRQPATPGERRRAFHALIACPTGSIGSASRDGLAAARDEFPVPVHGPVSFCGFTSPDSYGASSWFVRHPAGNWLVDSPRWTPRLAERFRAAGGLAWIFLTHQDDVADAARYSREFGARRVIHEFDRHAEPLAERLVQGADPVELAPGFTAIPTPGHTRGSMCLQHGPYLFTGDHVHGLRGEGRVDIFREYTWHSAEVQRASVAKLAGRGAEWILPGHGTSLHLPAAELKRQLEALAARI